MNIKFLRDKATASELVLINTVEALVTKDNLNIVLETFSKNLERNFSPSQRWESEEMKRTLQNTLAATQKELSLE